MIPIYLCEDDKNQLQIWHRVITNAILISEWDMNIKATATTPSDLLEKIDKQKPENAVYFLDIDLKSNINGIELASEIRKYDPRAFIVFVTTHDEMALYTLKIKVEPLGFIIKESSDFSQQIVECLQNVYEKYQVPNNSVTDVLSIQTECKVFIIPFDDIYYIEPSAQSHKICLHKAHERIEFSSSLINIQKKLDDRFAQCHKAFIVNCNHIRRIDKKNYTIYFDNGMQCPCSVRLCNPLCRLLAEHKAVSINSF